MTRESNITRVTLPLFCNRANSLLSVVVVVIA